MKATASDQTGEALRRLRNILGQTQRQFAEMIGVSLQLVKLIEQGRHRVGERLNRKILVATGATLGGSSLRFDSLKGDWKPFKNGAVLSAKGLAPYTIDVFHQHQRHFGAGDEGAVEDRLSEMLPELRALLKAAAAKSKKRGVKHRLPGLVLDFYEWIEEAAVRYNLNVEFPGPDSQAHG